MSKKYVLHIWNFLKGLYEIILILICHSLLLPLFFKCRNSIWFVLSQRRPATRTWTIGVMQWSLQILFLLTCFSELQIWPWCDHEKFWSLKLGYLHKLARVLAQSNWVGFLNPTFTFSQVLKQCRDLVVDWKVLFSL